MTEGEVKEVPWLLDQELADLIRRMRDEAHILESSDLDGSRYTPATASRILAACLEMNHEALLLGGLVEGDLVLGQHIPARLTIGSVNGALVVAPEGRIDGDLVIRGSVSDGVLVKGEVLGSVSVRGTLTSALVIQGNIGGEVTVEGSVDQGVKVASGAAVEGGISVDGEVGKVLIADGNASYLNVQGHVDGPVYVENVRGWVSIGTFEDESRHVVSGDVWVRGTVAGGVTIRGVTGLVKFANVGPVARRVTVEGDVVVSAPVGGVEFQWAEIGGKTRLGGVVGSEFKLRSVFGSRFRDDLVVRDRVSIETCDFRQCDDLDRIKFTGSSTDLFPNGKGLCNELMQKAPEDLASVNRRLRANLESKKNRPASSMFYKGEMDARRSVALERARGSDGWNARVRSGSDWIILAAYRSLSGYGLTAWRPFGWFLVIAAFGSATFAWSGLTLDSRQASVAEVVVFTVRSMIAFFSPPTAELTVRQDWLQIALRFAGPVLLAQAILAVRERVAR